MEKRITVVNYGFTENNRQQMTDCASSYGYQIVFHETAKEAARDAADAEILVGASPELLEYGPQARWYCGVFAGVDSILQDVPESMILTSASGAYGVTISEHILMILLELLRRRTEYLEIIKERKWIRDLSVRSICGSRITILGTGDIGTQTALRLRGFSPAWICGVNRSGRNPGKMYDRILRQDALDEVLPQTDILIMCMPGTAETSGMLSRERIAMLPQNALVINVGRGSAIDQSALVEALRTGKLGGAGLDVFETEPVPADDPVWSTPNLLMTPHISGNMSLGYTVDRIVDLFCTNLQNYCTGKPMINVVDRERGY